MKTSALLAGLIIAAVPAASVSAKEPKSAPPAKTETKQDAATAFAAVKGATLFSIGGIGVAGTKSPAEVAFRKVLTAPDAAALCQTLTTTATVEGRLYGLLGLKLLDAKAYAAAAPAFQKSDAKVKSAAGCELMETTVAAVAKNIAEGRFK